MRRITSVLDSSYIGLLYWTAWQTPKNIVPSSPAPRSWEASPGTPSFVVSVLRGRDGWTDPLLRLSPRLFSFLQPFLNGRLVTIPESFIFSRQLFHFLLVSVSPRKDKESKHRCECLRWTAEERKGRTGVNDGAAKVCPTNPKLFYSLKKLSHLTKWQSEINCST